MAKPPRKAAVRKQHVKKVAAEKRESPLSRLRLAQLPSLFHHTHGREFSAEDFQTWSELQASVPKVKIPSVPEAGELLEHIAVSGSSSSSSSSSCSKPGSRQVWQREGADWIDPEGEATINNVRGYAARKQGTSMRFSWHEYGFLYQLGRAAGESRPSFYVTQTNAYKVLGSVRTKDTMKFEVAGKQASFRSTVTFDPWSSKLGQVDPQWTFIYLHSFSNRGVDYEQYPHYFGVTEAPVRVVCPTAPLLEQKCFEDWKEFKGDKLGWRRVKFNAWFDYITDRGGRAENKIDLPSLLETRARIHGLIREEVRRVGGDPKRVIIGGASQGCCVALDAALTYPEELGGVVGLVGHVLSVTPLDLGKDRRSMPLHLFQEAKDSEMNWRWVKGIVDRVVAAGFNVILKREADPSGCGHWIQDIEGRWICSALHDIISGSSRKFCASDMEPLVGAVGGS